MLKKDTILNNASHSNMDNSEGSFAKCTQPVWLVAALIEYHILAKKYIYCNKLLRICCQNMHHYSN